MRRTSYVSDMMGLRESSLHRDLKSYYAYCHGGVIEQEVCGYKADVLVGTQAYEIQTKGFYRIRPKIQKLLDGGYSVCVVYPMQALLEVKLPLGGTRKLRRMSSPIRAFEELVYIAALLSQGRVSVEILKLHERGERSRRNRARNTRLVAVLGRWTVSGPSDLAALLPPDLPSPFTTADIAEKAGIGMNLADKVAYTLRVSGSARKVGSRNRFALYELSSPA